MTWKLKQMLQQALLQHLLVLHKADQAVEEM